MAGATEPASARAARRGIRLPATFDAWFSRATARSPRDRFAGVAEQIIQLASALGVKPPEFSRASRPRLADGASDSDPPWTPNEAARPRFTPEVYAETTPSLGASSESPGTALPSPNASDSPGRTSGSAHPDAATTGPVASDATPADPGSAAWTKVAVPIAAALVVAGALGVWSLSHRRTRQGPTTAVETATVGVAPVSHEAAPRPPDGGSGVAMANPEGASFGPAAPSLTAATALATSRPSRAAGLAGAGAHPKEYEDPRAPVQEGPRDTPRNNPVPPPTASCDPPYELDAAGHRHMKPQCL